MAARSRILAWEIPWTEEPDGLQSMGSQSCQAPLLSSLPHNIEQKELLLIHLSPLEKSTSPRKIVTAWTQLPLVNFCP